MVFVAASFFWRIFGRRLSERTCPPADRCGSVHNAGELGFRTYNSHGAQLGSTANTHRVAVMRHATCHDARGGYFTNNIRLLTG